MHCPARAQPNDDRQQARPQHAVAAIVWHAAIELLDHEPGLRIVIRFPPEIDLDYATGSPGQNDLPATGPFRTRQSFARGDKIARIIVDTYLAPNKTLPELREMVNSGSLDLLRDFSEDCRAELESLRAQQF